MSITGRKDGEAGAGPQKVGVALTDILTGLYATVGVLAALAHRDRTGEGQQIDLALLDVQVACLANQTANYLIGGMVPRRMGNAHPNIVPYQDFPTADGDMILAVGNDSQFAKFCDVAGKPDWARDARFATNADRVRHRAELMPLLRQATVMRTTREWIAALETAGVPCGPINRLDEVFADPQVIARGLRIELPHAVAGSVPGVANPIRMSASPVAYDRGPPTLGQHTDEVLAQWLGIRRRQPNRRMTARASATQAVLACHFAFGFLLVGRVGGRRHAVALGRPRAEVAVLASHAAERSRRIRRAVFARLPAGRAGDVALGAAQAGRRGGTAHLSSRLVSSRSGRGVKLGWSWPLRARRHARGRAAAVIHAHKASSNARSST